MPAHAATDRRGHPHANRSARPTVRLNAPFRRADRPSARVAHRPTALSLNMTRRCWQRRDWRHSPDRRCPTAFLHRNATCWMCSRRCKVRCDGQMSRSPATGGSRRRLLCPDPPGVFPFQNPCPPHRDRWLCGIRHLPLGRRHQRLQRIRARRKAETFIWMGIRWGTGWSSAWRAKPAGPRLERPDSIRNWARSGRARPSCRDRRKANAPANGNGRSRRR